MQWISLKDLIKQMTAIDTMSKEEPNKILVDSYLHHGFSISWRGNGLGKKKIRAPSRDSPLAQTGCSSEQYWQLPVAHQFPAVNIKQNELNVTLIPCTTLLIIHWSQSYSSSHHFFHLCKSPDSYDQWVPNGWVTI